MIEHCSHKNNIVLTDYNYQKDIDNRLLMAELSDLEVSILREIIDGSLKFSVKQLAELVEESPKNVIPALEKLKETGLFRIEGDNGIVDKEMRKYYESQIIKFDEEFEPGIEFLQGMLSKVPLHVLLHWYSFPAGTHQIVPSIIQHYMGTPKAYETYLSQLNFENVLLHAIMQDVFTATDYKVRAEDLMNKYGLMRKQFEEYLLLLEYNFVCCLSYERVKDRWEEVVTPFHEWRNYLRFQAATSPCPILDNHSINRFHLNDFGFVCDMAELLEMAQEDEVHPDTRSDYVVRLIAALNGLHLATVENKKLRALPGSHEWLLKSRQEQALTVYRYSMNRMRIRLVGESYNERAISEVERSLRRIAKFGWVYFDDFWKGFTAPIGSTEAVTLQNKGKKWWYDLPNYSTNDRDFVYSVIYELLFEAGMVAIGTHNKKPCFSITALGKLSF